MKFGAPQTALPHPKSHANCYDKEREGIMIWIGLDFLEYSSSVVSYKLIS